MQAPSVTPQLPQLSALPELPVAVDGDAGVVANTALAPVAPPQHLIPQINKSKLPEFLNISSADAALLTLSANDCHRLGSFPYFVDNINDMFVRLKRDKGETSYTWARVICGITADDLTRLGLIGAIPSSSLGDTSSSAMVYTTPSEEEEAALAATPEVMNSLEGRSWIQLPKLWRNRLLEEPIYEWRDKKFEIHLICEHPFAAGINKMFDKSQSPEEEEVEEEVEEEFVAEDGTIEKKIVKKTKKVEKPENWYFLASFRQLAKEHTPTQAEVDDYCGQFVPVDPNTIAATTSFGAGEAISASEAERRVAELALAYVPKGYKEAFLDLPQRTPEEIEVERLEQRINERLNKTRGHHRASAEVTQAGGDAALPHVAAASHACRKWREFFEKHVANRALTKEDAAKIVAANTRLGNVAGNAVIRGAVLYNLNLSRASQIEAARRLAAKSESQAYKAAQKEASRAALMSQSSPMSMRNLGGPSSASHELPLSTQLGSASQNVDEEPDTSSLLGGVPSSSVDVESLLIAALGPSATPSQVAEIRARLLNANSSNTIGADTAAGVRASSTSSSGSVSSSIGGGHGPFGAPKVVLLTTEELQAFERDDQQFNNYVTNEARRKDMDVLAAVTTRNTKANVALRLQGYKLMAERDREVEAEDDTMQPMWHTDADRRRKEADDYANKAKGEEAKKAGGPAKAAAGPPRHLTEEEEIKLYTEEAKRVNDAVLARQCSTTSFLSASSSSLSSQSLSPSLVRAPSAVAATSTAIFGAANDLDDLLGLTSEVKAKATASTSPSSATAIARVRSASLLSPEDRIAVSKTLGRVPIVAAGGKRERE